MSLDFLKKDELVVVVSEEDEYADDAEPAGADALLTRDFMCSPIEGSEVQRMLDRPGQGASPSMFAGRHMACSLKVEAAPSGTIGVPPAFSSILLCSQMAETIVEDIEEDPVEVHYEYVSRLLSSASLYANYDGVLFRLLGMRGAIGMEFEGGGIPYFTFNGMALLTLPEDVAMIEDADYSGFKLPELAEADTTQEVSIGDADFVLRNWQLQPPQNVAFRDLPGQKEVVIAGNRNLRSRLEVMAPRLDGFDPFAMKEAMTLAPFTLLHGSAAGKQWSFEGALTQIVGVAFGEHQGERTLQLELLHTSSPAGDDDGVWKFI
ncbi:MAG: hypothetical protein Q7V31_03780 [Parvibaculum sp.]|uniref:hypothetical protein n=1 Tax=Parvibaculum sp. TaxID=2024848 RepID=UPI00271B618A|nr:hypothetical protein [Parvibaculum sp.]MDO8838023.1 hypothetical protein [Parvibaculum sp.]